MDEHNAPARAETGHTLAVVRADSGAAQTKSTIDHSTGHTDESPVENIDPAIVARAAAGDEQAWVTIVDMFGRRLFALVRSRLGSPELAEEITQSVFTTVSLRLQAGRYAEQGKFEPWLFRIAINRIRDEIRRLSRHATPTDPVAFSQHSAPDTHAHADPSELAALRRAIEQLEDTDQQIVMLRHHAQMSFRDMADALGEPMGTLLARHHRALKKLRTIMEQDNEHR